MERIVVRPIQRARYQAATRKTAVLVEASEAYQALEDRRAAQVTPA